jgi:hypothetical protein
MNEKLLALDNMLAFHDWHYEFSDDYSQYTRGRNERAAINAEVKRLKDLGLVSEVDKLIVKYAPKT